MNYQRHSLKDHIRHQPADYLRCIHDPPRGLGKLQPDTVQAIIDLMPIESVEFYESQMQLNPGRHVDSHRHPEWVGLWYPIPGDPPHPVIIEGEAVQPEAGDVIILHPGVEHHVTAYPGKTPRVLFAVLVNDWREKCDT